MPPSKSHKSLTAEQKAMIKLWIEQGAPYQKHWAFESPVKAAVPDVGDGKSAVENPIDAFIVQRLDKEGLKLSPEADRETLIRRVTFDLTGLPTHACGNRRLPSRPIARCLRQGRHPAARFCALRRAHGSLLARPGPLRRHPRPAPRQRTLHVALPRLGHRRLQSQPALRSIHRRATRRRSPAQRHTRPNHRQRLQPLQRHDQRRRLDRTPNTSSATPSTAP